MAQRTSAGIDKLAGCLTPAALSHCFKSIGTNALGSRSIVSAALCVILFIGSAIRLCSRNNVRAHPSAAPHEVAADSASMTAAQTVVLCQYCSIAASLVDSASSCITRHLHCSCFILCIDDFCELPLLLFACALGWLHALPC